MMMALVVTCHRWTYDVVNVINVNTYLGDPKVASPSVCSVNVVSMAVCCICEVGGWCHRVGRVDSEGQ